MNARSCWKWVWLLSLWACDDAPGEGDLRDGAVDAAPDAALDAALDAADAADASDAAPDASDAEPWRPALHFSPQSGWQSDPNGLVFYRGEYHLFFQHFPETQGFHPMHWGHAVSVDLLRWREGPIALAPDPVLGQAFSGSAALAHGEAAALCQPGDAPCLALMFTHSGEDGQQQSLAVSHGDTFLPYPGNPVLQSAAPTHFRDPKVFRQAEGEPYAVVVAAGDHLEFFSSPDLVHWTPTGRFGPVAGLPAGLWECPDVLDLPVEGGAPGERRAVLVFSVLDLLVPRPSTVAFTGQLDAGVFVSDGTPPQLVDHAPDFYAVQSFANLARPVWLAWLGAWPYALRTPTEGFRGAMTLPREVALVRQGERDVLVQRPIPELLTLRAAPRFTGPLAPGFALPDLAPPYELELHLPDATADFSLTLLSDGTAATLFGQANGELFLDRTTSGTAPSPAFATRLRAPALPLGPATLRLFVDRASIEVFANEGATVLTAQVFPPKSAHRLAAPVVPPNATLTVWPLRPLP